jgi:hypothetical protein
MLKDLSNSPLAYRRSAAGARGSAATDGDRLLQRLVSQGQQTDEIHGLKWADEPEAGRGRTPEDRLSHGSLGLCRTDSLDGKSTPARLPAPLSSRILLGLPSVLFERVVGRDRQSVLVHP